MRHCQCGIAFSHVSLSCSFAAKLLSSERFSLSTSTMATQVKPATKSPIKKEPSDANSQTTVIKHEPKDKFGAKKFVIGKFDPENDPKKFTKGTFDHNKKGPKKGSKKFIKGKFDHRKKAPKKFANGKSDPEKKKDINKPKPNTKQVGGGNIPKKNFQLDPSGAASKFKKAKLSPAYFDAVTILRKMSLKKGSINSLIGTLKDQKNIKQVYALAINVIKNQEVIKQIVEKFPQPEGTTFDQLFIEVLIADMIIGQKRFIKYRASPEASFVLEHEAKINTFYKQIKNNAESKSSIVELPVRYIRINLLKTSKDDLIEKLTAEQYHLKSYSKAKISFEDFMKLARELGEMQFMVDYHFDDILLFRNADSKKLTELQLFKDALFALQDKSSMLAIEAMSLKPGMTVLDSCAAPGMKTIAIASRLNNDCILYANDMNTKRYKQMRVFLHKFGAKTEKLSNVDFSELDAVEYSNLDVILLDPSCSGSGMVRRFDYGEKKVDEEQTEKRVNKLAKFQLALLETALKFKPKKIVYCTCSKLQVENEDVVNQLLSNNPNIKYEVIDPLPNWPTRGTGDYEFSSLCLRSDMESTLTCGFFCCVLQRNEGATDDDDDVNMQEVKEEVEEEEHVEVKPEPMASPTKSARKSTRSKRKTANEEESDAPSELVVEEEVPMTTRKSKRLRI